MEDVMFKRCAGIDVHKRMIVACLRIGSKLQTREFGTLTHELKSLAEWLKDNNCEMIAMESTGSYWKPLYNIFEVEGLSAMIVNAQHMKAVPGRKTDVKDAEWIAKLLSQGLLKPSFIPDRTQRELRDLVRFRKSQTEERARNLNRLQKMLEGANIKIAGFVSDISGKSANELLNLVINKPDFSVEDVASHRHGGMKTSSEDLFLSLEGVVTPLQRNLLKHIIKIIKTQTKQIKQTSKLIEKHMNDVYIVASKKLTEIPGIGETSSQQIIAEIGCDMNRFPTAAHLCNWAGICPGNNESAGKRKSGKTNKANKYLKTTLAQCAHIAKRDKNSFFYAQYQRLVVRRGKNRATIAVAHSILIAIYHVLKGNTFKDLGSEYYTKFNKDKKINSYVKKLRQLGVNISDDALQAAIADEAV